MPEAIRTVLAGTGFFLAYLMALLLSSIIALQQHLPAAKAELLCFLGNNKARSGPKQVMAAMKIKALARAALIAAAYLAITSVPFISSFSYGPLQVRVAEALTLLPIIFPEAVPGLFIGCLLANILGPFGLVDIIGGSLVTLLAAYISYRFRRSIIAYLSPILLNALLVSLYLHLFFRLPYLPTALTIGLGQAIAVLGLGLPLLRYLKRTIKNKGD